MLDVLTSTNLHLVIISIQSFDPIARRKIITLSSIIENQAQPSLVCKHTLRVYEHSNGQKSPLSCVALTMSHRIIFYDT